MKSREKSPDCPTFKKLGSHGKMIGIDLDDTLLVGNGQFPGQPFPGVVARVKRLKELGYYILIHTARINDECEKIWGPQEPVITAALNEAGIPFDEIWTGRGKPICCKMADDKSYKTVAELMEEIERKVRDGFI